MAWSLQYKGFDYVAFYNGAYEDADSLTALAGTGANSAELTLDYGIDVNHSRVVGDPNYTDSRAALGRTIDEAKKSRPVGHGPAAYRFPGPVRDRHVQRGRLAAILSAVRCLRIFRQLQADDRCRGAACAATRRAIAVDRSRAGPARGATLSGVLDRHH